MQQHPQHSQEDQGRMQPWNQRVQRYPVRLQRSGGHVPDISGPLQPQVLQVRSCAMPMRTRAVRLHIPAMHLRWWAVRSQRGILHMHRPLLQLLDQVVQVQCPDVYLHDRSSNACPCVAATAGLPRIIGQLPACVVIRDQP